MNLFMDNDEKENNPMRFVDLEDKSLYNNDYASYRASSEFLDCSMPLVVDSYNVCSGNCFYCFAYVFKETNSMVDFNNLKIKSINVNKYKDIFEKKINIGSRDKLIYNLFFNKKKIIQWGSLANPFCNFERRYHIGEELVKIFIEQNYPVRFCSKFKIPDSILKLLQDNPHRNFVFMYSIVTADNKVSASVEDATHTPDARFKQLKELSENGILYYFTIKTIYCRNN
jgi:DNA repair photolyase